MFLSSTSNSISGCVQFPDDAEKFFDRHRGAPGFLTLGFHAAGDGHIQIGGGKFQPVAFRAKQHIGKNRQRRAGADDILTACSPLMICSLEMVRFIRRLIILSFRLKHYPY